MRMASLWRVVLVAAALGLAAVPAAAENTVDRDRIGGVDRYDTAARMATHAFPDGASHVILARGDDYADSLAAAPLASAKNAPVLLTGSTSLPTVTIDALEALDADAVTVAGGPGAVDPEVESALEAHGYEVVRLAGDDRYDTAAQLVERQVAREQVGELWGETTALVASGEGFADALMGGWYAALGDPPLPLVLTGGDHLPAATVDALEAAGVERTIIIGGEAAVSVDVADALEAEGFAVSRRAGDDRHGTAVQVADAAGRDFAHTSIEEIYLARDDHYADAVAAAPAVAQLERVLLLSHPDAEPYRGILADRACHNPGVDRVTAVGGEEAVSPAELDATAEMAGACR